MRSLWWCWVLGCLSLVASQCPDAWIHYASGSKCFKKADRDRYSTVCADSRLATIQDHETHKFLQDKLSYQDLNLWLGLDDKDTEGTYVWADGTTLNPWSYERWGAGEPDNSEVKDCVKGSNKRWFAVTCSGRNEAICEIPALDKNTTATQKTTATNVDGKAGDGAIDEVGEEDEDPGGDDTFKCAVNNGGCEAICINVPGGVNCDCEEGFVMIEEECVNKLSQTMMLIVVLFLFPLLLIGFILFLWSKRKTHNEDNSDDTPNGERPSKDKDNDNVKAKENNHERESTQKYSIKKPDDYDDSANTTGQNTPTRTKQEEPDSQRQSEVSVPLESDDSSSETMGGLYWRPRIHSTTFF